MRTLYAGVFGEGVYRREPSQVFGVVIVLGLVGAVIHIGPVLLSLVLAVPDDDPRQQRARTLWTLAYASIAITAITPSAAGGSPAAETVPLFGTLLWIGPLFGAMIGAGLLEWLLHPFAPRLAFAGSTPAWLRRPLGFVAWTAILPFGGLAVPIWAYLHHQRWPEYQARWLRSGQPG